VLCDIQKATKTKRTYLLPILVLLINSIVFAQDEKIFSKEPFGMSKRVLTIVNNITENVDSTFAKRFAQINFYRITYLSDGLKVTAYLAEPKLG
jgi:hypothetical protein